MHIYDAREPLGDPLIESRFEVRALKSVTFMIHNIEVGPLERTLSDAEDRRS